MQTSYAQYMGKAYAGMLADVQFKNNVVSKSLESLLAAPGLAVGRGTDTENQVVVGGTSPIGVVVRSLDTENNVSNELEYVAKETVGVVTTGCVWVDLITTGAAGDPIYSVDADGTIGAGVASTGQTQLVGMLQSVAAAPGLAIIELGPQLPVQAAAPAAHADTHQDGGTDEINVADLSGLLADPQTPIV